jgi:hypothetical protein
MRVGRALDLAAHDAKRRRHGAALILAQRLARELREALGVVGLDLGAAARA